MQNNDIVRALETIATLMEIKDEAYYRVLGYTRAAESVAALGRPVTEVDDLKTLPHVGATTAEVIRDLAEDRTPQLLADLTAEIPEGLVEITRLPSVGPRTVGRLWKELDVTNVEELAAMDPERISSLKGFGKKSAQKMVQAARTYNATERRMLLDEATSLGEQILSFVRSHPATERAEVGGSLRRMKETVGDIDIVAASEDPGSLADDFAEAPFAEEVLAHGPKKVFILSRRDRDRPENSRARGLRLALAPLHRRPGPQHRAARAGRQDGLSTSPSTAWPRQGPATTNPSLRKRISTRGSASPTSLRSYARTPARSKPQTAAVCPTSSP